MSNPIAIAERTRRVKQMASELGFDFCGISKATMLEDEAQRLESWLKAGKHGKMSYMENHFEKRVDPRKLVPDCRSVVSLLYNYYPEKEQDTDAEVKISRYAYGMDYHFVIKDLLKQFFARIQEEIGGVSGRVFVDSAPVLDKAWAVKSGLGWMGKHTNLINKEKGSYFFIAELIIDLELEEDGPIKDYCGTCTRCIDACPTDAIEEAYKVDGSKCISYFTIELKDAIPEDMKGKFEDWAFGCDICQEVCPWNKFSSPHHQPLFEPKPQLLEMKKGDWVEITKELFDELFRKSAIKRTGFEGLKRNIRFLDD